MLGATFLLCPRGRPEVGFEGFYLAFEFFENTFDGVPIPIRIRL
jgi:hypothetical protein